jgi:hypothetical protein
MSALAPFIRIRLGKQVADACTLVEIDGKIGKVFHQMTDLAA